MSRCTVIFRALSFLASCLFVASSIVACGGPRPGPEQSSTHQVRYELPALQLQGSVSGNGITVNFNKTADWDAGWGARGFTAEVTITNATGEPIDPWELEYSFLGTITSMWNASFAAQEDRFFITPDTWNATLSDGGGRGFGFTGTYTGVFQEPTAYVLSGIAIGDQGPLQPATPTCTLAVTMQITADWIDGAGLHGIVAEIYIANVGTQPVIWSMGLQTNATINDSWNATYEPSGDYGYVFSPASWNARVEPGQTRSFGFLAHYTNSLDETVLTTCPGQGREDDPVLAAYRAAYAQLTPAQVGYVEARRLVWNGTDFVVPSPLFFKDYVQGLGEFQGQGLRQQAGGMGEPQLPFECPLYKRDADGSLRNPMEVDDWGTFWAAITQPGSNAYPVSTMSGTFILPPASAMEKFEYSAGQTFYAMFSGWGDQAGGAAFDVGFGFQNGTWFFFTNRFNPSEPEESRYTAMVYRLAHRSGSDGVILPHLDTEPFVVRLDLLAGGVDEHGELVDGFLQAIATPLQDTVWWDPYMQALDEPLREHPLLQLDDTGAPSAIRLGFKEKGERNRGSDIGLRFPAQAVPGLSVAGIANRFSVQANIAIVEGSHQQPREGTSASEIAFYDLQINGTQVDVDDPDGPYGMFKLLCPREPDESDSGGGATGHPVYTYLRGKSDSQDRSYAYTIAVKVLTDNVHGCIPTDAMYFEPCPPQGSTGGPGGDPGNPKPEGSGMWGDPHIHTFDGFFYTFMAVGDYVLAETSDHSDSFMVQGRFRPFEGIAWGQPSTEQWSASEALAMNVDGTIVEFYASGDYMQPLVVINGEEAPAGDYVIPLPGGGSVKLDGITATAAWSDGSTISAELYTSPSGDERIAGTVRLTVPASRWSTLHGLFGTNDGLKWNDLNLPNGSILNITHWPDADVSKELYVGQFRSQWLVPASRSLFSRGINRFNPFYPSEVISLDNLSPAVVAAAESICRAQGVATAEVLSRCMMDVANTGIDSFAQIAAAMDPQVPGITLSPSGVYLTASDAVAIDAFVRGLPTGTQLEWTADEGSISGTGSTIFFTPPAEEGTYEVTAYLPTMPEVSATARVVVSGPLAIAPIEVWAYTGEEVPFAAYGLEGQAVEWFTAAGGITSAGRRATYLVPIQGGSVLVQASLVTQPLVRANAVVHIIGNALYPETPSVNPGTEVEFTWINAENLDIVWEATDGTIIGEGHSVIVVAPDIIGDYIITARSVSNPGIRATAVLNVHTFCCYN